MGTEKVSQAALRSLDESLNNMSADSLLINLCTHLFHALDISIS